MNRFTLSITTYQYFLESPQNHKTRGCILIKNQAARCRKKSPMYTAATTQEINHMKRERSHLKMKRREYRSCGIEEDNIYQWERILNEWTADCKIKTPVVRNTTVTKKQREETEKETLCVILPCSKNLSPPSSMNSYPCFFFGSSPRFDRSFLSLSLNLLLFISIKKKFSPSLTLFSCTATDALANLTGKHREREGGFSSGR